MLTCPECNVTYTRREKLTHTEKKCLEEQLGHAHREFESFKQEQDQIKAQLNETIKNLHQNFTAYKNQQERETQVLKKQFKDEQTKCADYQKQLAKLTKKQSSSHETASKLNIIQNCVRFPTLTYIPE